MRLAILAVTSVALASCGQAQAGPDAVKNSIKRAAASFNSQAPDLLGEEFGSTKVSSRIEGEDTLVLRIANAPVGDKSFDPNFVRKMMRPKVCETGEIRDIIDRGGRLKIELVSHIGAEFPPVLFSRC